MKAKRLGDPERPDAEEEDFFFVRRGSLGALFAGSGARRGGPAGLVSRSERFPGVDVDPRSRDPRDVWYEDRRGAPKPDER